MSDKLTLFVIKPRGSYPSHRPATHAEVLEALDAVPIRWCETHDQRLEGAWVDTDNCVEGRPRYDIPEEPDDPRMARFPNEGDMLRGRPEEDTP